MADKRAYFKVDVGYFTNPKVAAILAESPTAVILHLGSIAYSAQHLRDGIVPARLVGRLVGAEAGDADLLLNSGLWIKRDNGDIEIKDYLEHQRSAAEAKKLSDAGRKGAASRWQSESDANGIADGIANAVRTPMAREKEREKDNNNTATAAADADFDAFWAIYPRKDARANARKAYANAIKKATASKINAGLARHLPKWAAGEAKFIPHAATWLNGERWDDVVEAPKAIDGPRDQWARAIVVGGDR